MKNLRNRKKPQNLRIKTLDKQKLFVTLGILTLVFFFGISLLRNIAAVSRAKRTIEERRLAVTELEKENERLKIVLEETNSEEFIEKQIRDKLGLAKEGELIIVLPDEEVLVKLAPEIPKDTPSLPLENWEKWVGLFF